MADYGKITDEGITELRKLIGVERTGSSMHGQMEAMPIGRDIIRRFSIGIADMNPLYLNEEYARSSPHGAIILPPGMLSMIERVNGATDGLPGCHTIWRHATLEWYLPMRLGDIVRSSTRLVNVREVESKFGGGRSVIQDYETTVKNQNDETVGIFRTSWLRFERAKSKGAGKYMARPLANYTPEDIEDIKAQYKREVRRGSEPLYWEDVQVGEEIPPKIKGPTTTISKIAFELAGGPGGWVVGHELAFELFERHPGLPFINEQGAPEVPLAIHWSNERCQGYLGVAGAYESGYERVNWMVQGYMNWMGDHGRMKKLFVRFPRFSLLGDTTWCKGKVAEKRIEGENHIVALDVWTNNQLGEDTTLGQAEVILPSRGD
jgi:acyl dehydratase